MLRRVLGLGVLTVPMLFGAVHLRLDSPRGSFHPGECIPVVVEFSRTGPGAYELETSARRLPGDEFAMETGQASDPYRDSMGSPFWGRIFRGPREVQLLEDTPYSLRLNLNDWVRFDRPGRYRFTFRSLRVSREGRAFVTVSNALEIEIVPRDPAWEADKLGEIRADLRVPERAARAAQDLRYLATPAAIELMLRCGREVDFPALLYARDRAHAIAALEQRFAEPEVGITRRELRMRALLRLLEEEAQAPLWVSKIDCGRKLAETVRAEAIRLLPLVDRKTDAARAVSMSSLEGGAGGPAAG